ncbi:MAG: long-chain-fatty-acid--CoA ligase [Myxococcales bacterium]|nr:long-chain-fatty-acid--CoA ligase [Myxococcales bacterium]HIK83968.1 long-chain-fatty-acid--CoA ligase [Myxococcales bacterium]
MPITTLDQVLRLHSGERPNKVAMRAGDRSWTYADLYDESCRVAQALLLEGVLPQERVAFLDRNVPEYFSLLFGSAMVNAVTLAVNWRLAPPEMEYILNHAEAKVLLIGEEFLGHLEKMKLGTVKRVLVIGDGGEVIRYEDWYGGQDPIDPKLGCRDDETCYQLYTSGTTGLPKGVELTHRNLMAAMDVGAENWQIDETSVSMVAMPLFHIAGSGWAVGGFCQGGESILVRDMDPPEVIRLIEKHRVTNTLFVPAVLQILCATEGVEKADFSSLRSIVYGASPISEQVLATAMKIFGCGFIQVYGLTETTGAITVMPKEDHDPGGPKAHLLRSAGKAWGDTKIRIVDDESRKDLAEGEVGEIWIWSKQNMKGYWRNPEATMESYPEGLDENGVGWFRTGDAGYMKEGYLYIHDRVKDMIVSGGENIYPAEIENVLMSHPSIADAAVIGVPSEKWGESVTAIIVDAADEAVGDEEIRNYCRERLARYKCPTAVDRKSELPRNPSGKILKTELREPYWKGHARRVN